MKPSGLGAFCLGRLLIIDSISLLDIGLLRLSIPVSIVVHCFFQGIGSFYLGYQVCGHRIAHSIILLMFIESVVMPLFHFIDNSNILTSDINIVCPLFFLGNLGMGLLSLLIF